MPEPHDLAVNKIILNIIWQNATFAGREEAQVVLVEPSNGWQDESFVQVPFQFSFDWLSDTYTEVFPNANGYFTFGSGQKSRYAFFPTCNLLIGSLQAEMNRSASFSSYLAINIAAASSLCVTFLLVQVTTHTLI